MTTQYKEQLQKTKFQSPISVIFKGDVLVKVNVMYITKA